MANAADAAGGLGGSRAWAQGAVVASAGGFGSCLRGYGQRPDHRTSGGKDKDKE